MVFASFFINSIKNQIVNETNITSNYLVFAYNKSTQYYTVLQELLLNDKNGNRIMGVGAAINESNISSISTLFTESSFVNGSTTLIVNGGIDGVSWLQTYTYPGKSLAFFIDISGLGINVSELDGGSIHAWTGVSSEPANHSGYSLAEVELWLVPDTSTAPVAGDTYASTSGWTKLNITYTNTINQSVPYPTNYTLPPIESTYNITDFTIPASTTGALYHVYADGTTNTGTMGTTVYNTDNYTHKFKFRITDFGSNTYAGLATTMNAAGTQGYSLSEDNIWLGTNVQLGTASTTGINGLTLNKDYECLINRVGTFITIEITDLSDGTIARSLTYTLPDNYNMIVEPITFGTRYSNTSSYGSLGADFYDIIINNDTVNPGGSGTGTTTSETSPFLLSGNNAQFNNAWRQQNIAHSGTGPTAGMVEKSDVSARLDTNGLIMYASSAYANTSDWGDLTNLLDTGFTANYTGKWSGGTTQNIVFQFGSSFTFTKVVWKERSYGAGYSDPTLNNIKYWDGSAYQNITTTQTTSPSTGSNRVHTYTITTPPSSQYIRMEFSSTNTTYFPIGEIEVYGYIYSGTSGNTNSLSSNLTISGGTAGTDYKTYQTANGEDYIVFLTEGITYTLTSDATRNYDYFVVGGGGAGGGGDTTYSRFSASAPANTGGASGSQGMDSSGGGGGGGGGGAVKEGSETNKAAGSYTISVGKGQTLVGAGSTGGFERDADVNPAGDSVFDTIVSGGGGAGLYLPFKLSTLSNASNGGGGGGGSASNGPGGTSDTGFNGGNGGIYSNLYPGGGGAGAGGAGGNAVSNTTPGTGGIGVKPTNVNIINAISYFNNNGTPIGELDNNEYWFGGGGGGGVYNQSAVGAVGGKGGGTRGSDGSQSTAGLGGSGVVVLVVR